MGQTSSRYVLPAWEPNFGHGILGNFWVWYAPGPGQATLRQREGGVGEELEAEEEAGTGKDSGTAGGWEE